MTPHLMVRGGRNAIAFYTKALGAVLLYADATCQQALDAGARPILPIGDALYGDRFGWVLDPFGHVWAISTVTEELTPEQVHARMVAAHG